MADLQATLTGIHHVTAITADAQKNVDFYCGVLGLRLVKLTVNFDDPGSGGCTCSRSTASTDRLCGLL